jgi:hypothetical protein
MRYGRKAIARFRCYSSKVVVTVAGYFTKTIGTY